jgi:hypothetical protein
VKVGDLVQWNYRSSHATCLPVGLEEGISRGIVVQLGTGQLEGWYKIFFAQDSAYWMWLSEKEIKRLNKD